jgi:hypothetical protein
VAKAVQVHLKTPASASQKGLGLVEVHQMTWVESSLKPTKGMVIETKGDSRPWTVVSAYAIHAELDGLAPWKEVINA